MITTNKYRNTVFIPPSSYTRPEKIIMDTLDSLGIHEKNNNKGLKYVPGFFFDEAGYRRKKYDIGILKNDVPVLLIEYDGEGHFEESFYKSTGVRPERCSAHVVKAEIGEAIKTVLAWKHNVPCIRLNKLHMSHIRSLLMAYVEIVVNEKECLKNANNEIIMIDMFEKYGWDIDYVPPSEPSKQEILRLQELKERYSP